MKKKAAQVGAQFHDDVLAQILEPDGRFYLLNGRKVRPASELQQVGRTYRGKPAQKSLAKRILEVAKSDISDQLKEGEIATLFGQEVHKAVFEILKQIQK